MKIWLVPYSKAMKAHLCPASSLTLSTNSPAVLTRIAPITRMGRIAMMALMAVVLPAASAMARETIPLRLGAFNVQAEVAATPDQRARGLMFRDRLADNHGMLFVFEQAAPICMWMKNTPLPLAVAFVDARGAIINVESMVPRTETPHCAAAPALYALEMADGWFRDRGLGPGRRIEGLPPVGSSRQPSR